MNEVIFVGHHDDCNLVTNILAGIAETKHQDIENISLEQILTNILGSNEVKLLISGWASRSLRDLPEAGKIYAPQIAKIAQQKRIPYILFTSHPDAIAPAGSILIDKSTLDTKPFKSRASALLGIS